MAFEKRWGVRPANLFTSNGGFRGQITVLDASCFKVKQQVTIKANTLDSVRVEIKSVIDNNIEVGAIGKPITDRSVDLSLYTVALSATIEAEEQKRPEIPQVEHERAVYEEEPTVAKRVFQVDKLGRGYTKANPFPVQLSDGSIEIGTVNAEVEVQLSHLDNYPDVGDVADSIRIGDGTDLLAINPDGSINVASANTPTIVNINVVLADTEYSYVFPLATRMFTLKDRNGDAKTRIAYISGNTFTSFTTINMGNIYKMNDLNTLSGLTIYFQSNKANRVIEIESWK